MTDFAVSHGILDQPGTVAFLVIFGMAVILFFVFRSMAKHLRKVQMAARAEAEEAARARDASGDTGADFVTGADTGGVIGDARGGNRGVAP
ncbi:MAG TPA: hypothetical protein VJT16_11560 [Streptosporangiaceae bacterium]|nr:hypothetical protein [Streptosporangiaceae bacterium]